MTAETKFTPGPWYFSHNSWEMSSVYVLAQHIADVPIRADVTEETQGELEAVKEANAHLIAAAPELYEELVQAVIQMEMAAECIEKRRYDEALLHVSSMMRTKRAALAKARGE